MAGEDREGFEGLSPSEARRVDAACRRFEVDWRSGRVPRIEDQLGEVDPSLRPALLRELLALELELRHGRGERPDRESYRERFPEDSGAVDAAFAEVAPTGPADGEPRAPGRARADADRGLLLGLLALQNNFIDRDALLGAFGDWIADKGRPLGRILQGRGELDRETHALLEALVRKHLEQHDGDPERSLAALSTLGPVRRDLERIADPELHASLARVAADRGPDDPGPGTVSTIGDPASPGGRFRILRPHARGGLGEIYIARDEELHREVALKQIQPHRADDAESRARFVVEAEITGGLEHPGIIPIYGLGTYDDGRPFYAMRFIKGDSLRQAIKDFHGADAAGRDPGRRALGLRQLLGRFLDACNAVAYAHSRGVLHRDLKPGNILLGPFGETLVVDWGLAKVVGRSDGSSDAGERTLMPPSASELAETQPGAPMGTPAYMSPEQAAGAVDRLGPASDVYSLGAILYHLLTGQAPFVDRDTDRVMRRVQRGDFPPPRSVAPGVPRALEAVCLKAMAREPEGRYPSPRALADDVERWLAGEPVSAWREPISTRAQRWVRRHRTLVTTAAAVVVLGVAGLAGFSAVLSGKNRELDGKNRELDEQNRRLVAQRNRAVAAEGSARDEMAKARKSESEARSVLEFFRERVLAAARPEDLEGGLGVDATVREAVDAAEARIEETFAGQPAVEASIRDALGESYYYLGAPDLAIRQFEQTLALRRQALGSAHADTLAAMNNLAAAYRTAGRTQDALRLHEETLKTRRATLDPGHPDILVSMNNLAIAYQVDGRVEEALPLLEEVLRRQRAALDPGHPEILISMSNLAAAYQDAGRVDEALPLLEEATKGSRSALGPDHLDTLLLMNNLAMVLRDAGRVNEAVPLLEEILRRREAKLGAGHQLTLSSMNNLAMAYRDAGRLPDAVPLLEGALRRQRTDLGPDHPDTLISMNNLATVYRNAGRITEAIPLLEEARRGRRAKLGPDHPDTLMSMNNLAGAYLVAGEPGRAEPLLREALALREKATPDDWLTSWTRSLLGDSLLGQEKHAEAEPLLLAGYDGLKAREASIPAPQKKRLAEAGDRIVRLYTAWGREDKAAEWRKTLGEQAGGRRP